MPPSEEIRNSEKARIAAWLKKNHAPGCEDRDCAAMRQWLRELATYVCDHAKSEDDETRCPPENEKCPPCLATVLVLDGRA